jgi:hypothetical protein
MIDPPTHIVLTGPVNIWVIGISSARRMRATQAA